MSGGLFGLRGTFALIHGQVCPRALALYRRFPHVAVLPAGASMVIKAQRT